MSLNKLVEEITKPFLNEGINDPGILKAIFLAGGPGSGKGLCFQRIVWDTKESKCLCLWDEGCKSRQRIGKDVEEVRIWYRLR